MVDMETVTFFGVKPQALESEDVVRCSESFLKKNVHLFQMLIHIIYISYNVHIYSYVDMYCLVGCQQSSASF